MAELAKVGTPSLASLLPPANCQHAGLYAGENLAAGDMVYIKNDGKVWRSTGAAANAAAKVRGTVLIPANTGESATIMWNVTIYYATGLTPGADIYLSGTNPGGIADAASTGGTAPIGYVVDATRVYVRQSTY